MGEQLMLDGRTSLESLRVKRRAKVLREIGIARSTIRAQRSDLARILREWRGVSKRINAALAKYERAIDGLDGIIAPFPLQPTDLVACLQGCVSDEQTTKLEEIELELQAHETAIRAAGKKRARKVARRAARRTVKRVFG